MRELWVGAVCGVVLCTETEYTDVEEEARYGALHGKFRASFLATSTFSRGFTAFSLMSLFDVV
jgi:hypothetical protein